jgi:hypothetical protein
MNEGMLRRFLHMPYIVETEIGTISGVLIGADGLHLVLGALPDRQVVIINHWFSIKSGRSHS